MFVVERTEGASPGIVSSVTPAEIVVSVSGRERGLTKETVAWIERSPDPIWDGAALGAVAGLPMGLTGAAFGSGEALPLFVRGRGGDRRRVRRRHPGQVSGVWPYPPLLLHAQTPSRVVAR